jgi:alpha-glucosidase
MRERWRGAVIYRICPRRFRDSNGDRTGDLPGITRQFGHVGAFLGTVASRQGHEGDNDG